MKNTERKAILSDIDACLDNIVTILEEERFYPSVREAGTAPTENAVDQSRNYIIEMVEGFQNLDIKKGDLSAPISLEQIVEEIESVQHKNIGDSFDELKEVDTLIRDSGDRKYEYFVYVYYHKMSDQYIAVEEKRAMIGHDDWDVQSVSVSKTEKKEIVTYQWS